MAEPKLTPNQLRLAEEIQGFLKTIAQVKKLVGELESNRAARVEILQGISSQIAREFSRLRQRAISANIGTVADVAGSLATMAGRSQGLQMKIRNLNEGVASLTFQLERALAVAMTPEEKRPSGR